MIKPSIGYMICETATTEEEHAAIIVSEKNNRVTAEVILQDMDTKNRNGRYYATKEILPELTCSRTKELISTGNLRSENGHPMSKDIGRQQTIDPMLTCCKIVKLWTEGKDIKAHVRGTQNDLGEYFNRDILDGEKPSFSLRALGSVVNTNRGAEVRNIKIITWDRVIYPSHPTAYMQKIVSESSAIGLEDNNFALEKNDKGLFIPITNKSVIDYIKHESANINSILTSFDTLYENTQIIENGRKVQLTGRDGSIFVVNLESHIQNEIMDYCDRQ